MDFADCGYVSLLLLQHAISAWLSFKPLTLLHNGHYKIPLIGLYLGPIVVRFKKEIGETCVCTFFVSSLQVAEVLQPTGKKTKQNKTHPHRASGSGGLTLQFILVQYKTCLCVWLPVRKPKGRLQTFTVWSASASRCDGRA